MLAVLVLAPLVGLAWGARAKRVGRGLCVGTLVGAGNYVLWTVYNAITAKLGLDTVANLLVNLGLFLVLGTLTGITAGWFSTRSRQGIQGGEHGNVAGDRD